MRTSSDLTPMRAFTLGMAGGSSVLATFVAVVWAGSKLLAHYDAVEERVLREREGTR